jgi:hypothetical protein
MKKILVVFPVILLVAAACNSSTSLQTTQQQPAQSVPPTQNSTPSPTTVALPTTEKAKNCDMECLIAVASKCQQASGEVSYSSPGWIVAQIAEVGHSRFEIKPGQNPGDCTLVTTILSGGYSVSDSDRQVLIAGSSKLPPMTGAQIDAEIKKGNDYISKYINTPVTCTGSAAAVASYLTDVKNQVVGSSMSFVIDFLHNSGGTMTHKTKTELKLVCTLK